MSLRIGSEDARPAVVYESLDERDHVAAAERIARVLRPGDVLALHGELGAGKTQFGRGLARGLGIELSRVSSPTFVLAHEYRRDDGEGIRLVHVDAYRLTSAEDLAAIGWDRLVGEDAIVALEWAERVDAGLPGVGEVRRLDVLLEHTAETRRRITVRCVAARSPAIHAVVAEHVESRGAARGPSRCAMCGGEMSEEARAMFAPFCSRRCRMADLSKWFDGAYVISRPVQERDLEEGV